MNITFNAGDTITLWVFYYNSCIHESAPSIMSYHLTKEGAEKAMNTNKEYQRKEFEEMFKDKKYMKFGQHEDWFVRETTITINR